MTPVNEAEPVGTAVRPRSVLARNLVRFLPVGMIGVLCGVGFALSGPGKDEHAGASSRCTTLAQLLGRPEGDLPRRPLDLPRHVPPGLAIQPIRYGWLSKGWDLPEGYAPSAGFFLHMMHLGGADADLALGREGERVRLLDVLTDDEQSRRWLGQAAAIPVRTGVRFPTVPADPRLATPGDESHRDQCLACLARLGLPLTHPLRVDGLAYTLADVLRDSLANFDLHQKELEWTGVAYALYLPPLRGWKNRFGEAFSFDDLTLELLGRSLGHSPCGGSHRLMLLNVLHRADAARPVLTEPVRARLGAFLRTSVDLAVSKQRPDGTWPADWIWGLIPDENPKNWTAKATADSDILTCGHLLEWFYDLPEGLQPPRPTFERALQAVRSRVVTLDRGQFLANFCPNTHALLSVNMAAAGGPSPRAWDRSVASGPGAERGTLLDGARPR